MWMRQLCGGSDVRNSITLRSVWCAKHSDCQLTEAETTSYYPTTTTTKQSKQTTNNNNNNNNNPQSNTKQDPRQEREKKGERERAKERERELPSLYGNKPNMPRDQQIYILTVNRERDRQQTLGVGECVCEQIIELNSKCEMRKSFRGRTSNEHILPIPISIFGFER